MNEAETPASDRPTSVTLPAVAASSPHLLAQTERRMRASWIVALLAAVLSAVSLVLALRIDQRGRAVEQELVRRQQESTGQSAEARLFGKQAQDVARDAAAKVALLEARVAEVAMQRSQLEELMQSLSRSRDENLLVDVEASIRVALQQTAITGSAEPLVLTLKQTDERLARYNQPRLEGVRRAIARDLDRVKAAGVADVATLSIKIDEAIRMIDELPMLASAAPIHAGSDATLNASLRSVHASTAKGLGSIAPAVDGRALKASAIAASQTNGGGFDWPWSFNFDEATGRFFTRVWDEVKSLVRVTHIDHPDAVLMAPDQAFFVKENIKLRLLNARLALLSRQFDTAQSDLQLALAALDRYFDRDARRTALAAELIRQVAVQARQGGVPRPDDTLAAVAAVAAGR